MADRVIVMGRNPGRIVAEIPVDIPRPRHIEDMVDEPVFRALRHDVKKALLS